MVEDFSELMSNIIIKRQTDASTEVYGRANLNNFTTLVIQGIFQATTSLITTSFTTDKGRFATGNMLLMTVEVLNTPKDGIEDIVVGDDGEYRIISKKPYDKLLPHFEYICSRII